MAGNRNRARTYKPRINESVNQPTIQEESTAESIKQEVEEITFEENIDVVEEEVFNETSHEDIEEQTEVIHEENIVEIEQQEEESIEDEQKEIVLIEDEELPEINIPRNEFIQNIYESNEKSNQYQSNDISNNIPHYKVKRNVNNGSLEIINTTQEEKKDMSQTIELARKMLSQIDQEIIKNSLEIQIHSEIVKTLLDQNEITRMESKIEVLNKQVEYSEQRKIALIQIIGAQ